MVATTEFHALNHQLCPGSIAKLFENAPALMSFAGLIFRELRTLFSVEHSGGMLPMKRNKTLSYGLLSLVMIIAVPLLARAGTWQPLNNQPPMPDITDPQTGAFLCE